MIKTFDKKRANWFTENLPILIIILVFLALLLFAIALKGKHILRVI